MSEPIVRVSCVRHTYPDRTQVHLCGLDFVVEPGQRVVMLGPNGCGKTTLLYHILGLLEAQEGEIAVFGVNPARHFNRIRERVGVLLQSVDEQIIAPTVWDDVSFSPRNYGYGDPDVERMTREALERVGIAHLRHKVCHYLSGGERRKVALAGALVLQPELLVLDEPFEGLDPASRADLVELLNQLHREHGVTLVMATHDVNVVKAMADVVYVLVGGGEIVAHGTPEQIFRDPELLRSRSSSRRCWPSCSRASRNRAWRSAARSRWRRRPRRSWSGAAARLRHGSHRSRRGLPRRRPWPRMGTRRPPRRGRRRPPRPLRRPSPESCPSSSTTIPATSARPRTRRTGRDPAPRGARPRER